LLLTLISNLLELRRIDMPYYMLQARLTTDSWKALLNNPHDRAPLVAKVIEAHHGKLHNYFFAFGDNDVVALIEAPDNESVMAATLAFAGSGAVSGLKTTPLVPSSDAVDVFKASAAKAGAYIPPSG
jgi:uncharacterized protein with GYD domain